MSIIQLGFYIYDHIQNSKSGNESNSAKIVVLDDDGRPAPPSFNSILSKVASFTALSFDLENGRVEFPFFPEKIQAQKLTYNESDYETPLPDDLPPPYSPKKNSALDPSVETSNATRISTVTVIERPIAGAIEIEPPIASAINSNISVPLEDQKTYLMIISNKISEIAFKVFAFLKELFLRKGTEFVQIAWPYTSDPQEEGLNFIDEIVERAHESLNEPPEKPLPFYEESASPILTSIAGTANIATNYIVIPYSLAQEGDSSFTSFSTAIITAKMSQHYFSYFLGLSGDHSYQNKYYQLLQHYDLISTMDRTDLTLYQGGVAAAAHLVCANLDSLKTGMPLFAFKTAVVFVANFPPAQKAAAKTELFQKCSHLIHKTTDYFRNTAIDILAKPIEKMVVHSTKKLMAERKPYVDCMQEMVDLSEFTGPLNSGINSFYDCLSPQLQNLTDAVVDKEIKQPLIKMTADATRATARSISAYIVDSGVSSVITTIETALFNRAVAQIFTSHPLLGCTVFVLGGGTNQSVKELSLRVAGAAVMCYTGSIFFATIVTCTPPAIEYVWNLRAEAKKRSEKKKLMINQRKTELLKNKKMEPDSRIKPLFKFKPSVNIRSVLPLLIPYQVKMIVSKLSSLNTSQFNTGFGC